MLNTSGLSILKYTRILKTHHPDLTLYCSKTEDDSEINFIAYQSLASFKCALKFMVVRLI